MSSATVLKKQAQYRIQTLLLRRIPARPLEFLISQHVVQLGVTTPVAWSYTPPWQIASTLSMSRGTVVSCSIPVAVTSTCTAHVSEGRACCSGRRSASAHHVLNSRAPERPQTVNPLLHEELRLQGVCQAFVHLEVVEVNARLHCQHHALLQHPRCPVSGRRQDCEDSTERVHGWCAYRSALMPGSSTRCTPRG